MLLCGLTRAQLRHIVDGPQHLTTRSSRAQACLSRCMRLAWLWVGCMQLLGQNSDCKVWPGAEALICWFFYWPTIMLDPIMAMMAHGPPAAAVATCCATEGKAPWWPWGHDFSSKQNKWDHEKAKIQNIIQICCFEFVLATSWQSYDILQNFGNIYNCKIIIVGRTLMMTALYTVMPSFKPWSLEEGWMRSIFPAFPYMYSLLKQPLQDRDKCYCAAKARYYR